MAGGYEHTVAVDEATKRRLVVVARILFFVALALVLVLAAVDNADELRDVDLEPTPGWLLAAVPFTLFGGWLLPMAWRHVLRSYGTDLPQATALRVWCISQASRFIPGNVALVTSRVLLTSREGVPRSLAGASLAVEIGLIVMWSAVLTSWLPSTWLPWPFRLLIAAASLGVLAGLPWVLRFAGRFVPRFPALAPDALRIRHLYEAIGLYGLNTWVRSCAFVFVTASLHTIDTRDVFLVIGAVNLAAVAGMIGITPAGLGVREGVATALLTHRFGAGTSAALAVAWRAWDFLFELLWLAVAVTWERRRRGR